MGEVEWVNECIDLYIEARWQLLPSTYAYALRVRVHTYIILQLTESYPKVPSSFLVKSFNMHRPIHIYIPSYGQERKKAFISFRFSSSPSSPLSVR